MIDDRRSEFFRSYHHASAIVATVQPEEVRLPTPCQRFDVSALIDHIVGAGFRAAALGRGETPSGDDFPHVELVDAPEELGRAGKEAEAAWSNDASLTRQITMPWGEAYTGSTLVDMYLAELTTHAWDLAAATGRLDRLDPELAPSALEGARSMLKPEYRNMVETGSPFGPEVEPPTGATDWERLAAFMGRLPRPDAA